MRKFIIKLDRSILDWLTEYIRAWIEKNDYEKHKVDYTIKIQRIRLICLFLMAMLLPGLWFIAMGKFFSGGFHLAIWSISVGMSYYRLQKTIYETKPRHDIMFSARKNPAIYEMEKVVLEHVFIATRKTRILFMSLDFGVSWFLAVSLLLLWAFSPFPSPYLITALYFTISPIIELIDQYLFYVFDFDEPKPRKRKKESLTQILLKEWQKIVEGFSPQPNYGT